MLGVLAQVLNPSAQEAKAGGAMCVQARLCLQGELQDSQDYAVRAYLQKKKRSIDSKRTKEEVRTCAGICVGGQDKQPSVDRESNALASPFLTSTGIFPLAQLSAENLDFIFFSFGRNLDFC